MACLTLQTAFTSKRLEDLPLPLRVVRCTWNAGKLLYKMVRSKLSSGRKVKRTTVPFLSLPLEIRLEIYFLVIRPDCKQSLRVYCEKQHEHQDGSRGCTNLLVLCSQIYTEAIEMLHSKEQKFLVSATAMQVFRHGKDYPRPYEFYMNKRTSRCYLPPRLSELEFIRFRKLELVLFVPERGGAPEDVDSHVKRVARNITVVANAISKMTNLQYVRLSFKHEGLSRWRHWEGHRGRLNALCRLLRAIISKRALLVFGSNYYNDGDEFMPTEDRLLFEIRLLAIRLARKDGVSVRILGQADLNGMLGAVGFSSIQTTGHVDSSDSETTSSSSSEASDEIQHRAPESLARGSIGPEDHFDLERRQSTAEGGIAGILSEDYKPFDISLEEYRVVPECRQCLNVFASQASLKNHLKHHRGHRTPYRYREENKVHLLFRTTSERKCWTCGRGYVSLEYLNKHLDRMHHRRHGIIPRYREDNKEYDRYWARWLNLKGWL